MYKKWKSVTAISMAALLGCLMPMGTMLAAEDNTEAVQESEANPVSDADEVYGGESNVDENESAGDEVNSDGENTDDVVNADDEENIGSEVNEDNENVGEEADVDAANVEDEADTYGNENAGIEVMSETDAPEAAGIESQADLPAPVINITFNGQSCKVDGLGGKIDYKYVNNTDGKFEFSASQDGQDVAFYYYLDRVEDITANAKEEGELGLLWSSEAQTSSMTMGLGDNQNYVLYMKVVAGDQSIYAHSCGVIVDTTAPKIVGLDEGKAYAEGTTFQVDEANLDSVKVNETIVTPDSDGNYQVSANGTSCLIRVRDKAGNEKTCSITVTARNLEENGVISVNGTYALKAGTSYQLAEGKWQVHGDGTIYQGGSAFYVKTDGNYRFTKR